MLRTSFLLGALLLAATPRSQADPLAARAAFGVQTLAGELRAMGPDYGATFTPAGVTFTPVLGSAAAEPATLAWQLTEVRRGAAVAFRRSEAVSPFATGDSVRYPHTANLTEVYDVRADGIEQSFVLQERPAGGGDLLVRGQIRTALPLNHEGADGVRWVLPSGGGVSFGAVTGIDANGKTATGSLRMCGGELELALPAAFVDGAAYPLVLDPLIGAVIPIGDVAGAPDRVPSVAYDEGTNRFLVAWSVQYAASSWEVRGQIVSGGGVLQGAPFTISTPGVNTLIDRACAASVRGAGRFVVAMRGLGAVNSLSVRSISAANGSLGAITPLITSLTQNVVQATIGGDSRVGGGNALVGYVSLNLSNGARLPHTTMLLVSAAGAFTTVVAANQLAPNSINNPEIAVSRHGGLLGNWLTAWTDQTGSGAMRKVNAMVIGPAGTACSPIINVEQTNSGAETCSEVACATRDGALGLVTWTYSTGATKSVHCRPLVTLGSCGATTNTVGNLVVLAAGTGLRDRPAVDFAANKFVLAFRERTSVGGTARVVVLGLDHNFGTPAGAEHYPDGWLPVDADPTITAKWSGGSTADDALVAWSNDTAIRGHRFEATGTGTVTALGGACGIVGFNDIATYSGTPALGTTFTIDLSSPTAPILGLIVGFTTAPSNCGPCTMVPSVDIVLPPINPTVVALPNAPYLIGVALHAQWLQYRPSGCPTQPDFGLSNTLRFLIAE
ncbi:MAG: hypothetical protein IT456_07400 [Planctomycetes bacterium]|nr:hypothetical protein [Planctomycetota bacterium]